ncbi:MAG: ATP-dependent DNA helicase, partial [Gemmatimonadota bacterium]
QRMMAEDLLAAVFPDAAACLENIPGDREIPDHPLARQTIEDCLNEAMDIDQLILLLEKIHRGELTLIARDLPEPSLLAHEILNAKPYAFLDDAPLEERRTQAVMTRRALDPSSAADLGALDQAAIDRVRDEAWPDPRDADEMHDSLSVTGYFLDSETWASGQVGKWEGAEPRPSWSAFLEELVRTRRASRFDVLEPARTFWVAAERLSDIQSVHGDSRSPDRPGAIRELIRGRMEIIGPSTATELAESLGVVGSDVDIALVELEREGVILRGQFTPGPAATPGPPAHLPTCPLEWCDRRLLARIHRYTLNRLRSEIAPVSAAEFMRFLLSWQRLDPENHARGLEGLAAVIGQLDGVESPASAWETDVLGARCADYDPMLLDTLCLTGRVMWGRLSGQVGKWVSGQEEGETPRVVRVSSRPIRSTPIALFQRRNAGQWLALTVSPEAQGEPALSSSGQAVLDQLRQRGASFFHDLVQASGMLPTQVEQALGELAALGIVTSDSFAGLRALLVPSAMRKPFGSSTRRHRMAAVGVESAGRWSLLRPATEFPLAQHGRGGQGVRDEGVAILAWTLLRRYGVVFKRVLARESLKVGWRQLAMTYRRLEARGEIRGGRFVNGMSGEQFALPEAVSSLRAIRREAPRGQLISISAADPLNLIGLVTPGERVPALRRNRIVFEDGVPLAALESGTIRQLAEYPGERASEIERALVRRRTLTAPTKATASSQ